MKSITALAALALCACSAEQPKSTAEAIAAGTMEASQRLMKPAEEAALQGIADHLEATNARGAATKEKRLAAAEAAKPKAYRWKDAAGQWHISDTAPSDGTATEVIALQ